MRVMHSRVVYKVLIIGICFYSFNSCKRYLNREYSKEFIIEKKVDSLLALMTLDEKIGQMSQVRHFDDISDDDITTKFIGSVIHTQGPTPGKDAAGWQARFVTLQ